MKPQSESDPVQDSRIVFIFYLNFKEEIVYDKQKSIC